MNNKIIITCLVILSVFLIGYIFITGYSDKMEIEKEEIFQEGIEQGAQYGAEQTILEIFQLVSSCQQVPMVVQNQTVNLFAVECLQQEVKK